MYRALICDDEKVQRDGLAHHVSWAEYGFEQPVLCPNAWEALTALNQQRFDLMMTDIRMPGKDGLELAAESRSIQPELYVVMISSYAEFDYAREALKNGAREYLLKPIKPQDVHQILASFLQWKGTADTGTPGVDQNAARVMSLLEEHLMEGITIAEIAEKVHMNASYLCTLFKKTYGVTIADQLNQMQRDKACQLLAMSDLSMSEIADRTGGRTASHFAQWFRKTVGIPPGEYRRLVREKKAEQSTGRGANRSVRKPEDM